jgi:hypothetical protein
MYVKVFASLFEGSFYGAGAVRYAVWVYLLAKANPDGIVSCNVQAVSGAIGCSSTDVSEALAWLQAPDDKSRNPAHEGRRIEAVSPYEFLLLNYEYYRGLKTREMEREGARERQRRHRHDASQKSRTSRQEEEEKDVDVKKEGENVNGLPATPVSKSVALVKAPSWTAEACEDWTEGTGGTAPGGRIGKALKPFVERLARDKGLTFEATWLAVRPWWKKFCASEDVKFGPQAFAENPRRVLPRASSKAAARQAGTDAMIAGSLMGMEAALKFRSEK